MKNKKILIIALGCVAVCLCLFGIVSLNNNDKEKNPEIENKQPMTDEEARKDYESRINDPNAYENGAMGYGFIVR